MQVFGSGWAWLYLDKSTTPAKLVVGPSFNQFTPANDSKKVPLLTLVSALACTGAGGLRASSLACLLTSRLLLACVCARRSMSTLPFRTCGALHGLAE